MYNRSCTFPFGLSDEGETEFLSIICREVLEIFGFDLSVASIFLSAFSFSYSRNNKEDINIVGQE